MKTPGLLLRPRSLLCATACVAATLCRAADPLWSIGQPDNSADEFSPGAARSVVYQTGKSTAKDWPARQGVNADNEIRFELRELNAAGYRLIVHGFFLEAGPQDLELLVNGRKGAFRLKPQHGEDSDFRQGGNFLYAVFRLEAPLGAELLRVGANSIHLKVSGTGGGALNYDYLALEAASAPPATVVRVEPTIFFRNGPGGLSEVTEIVVSHPAPLADASLSLKIGDAAPILAKLPTRGDFGEEVATVNIPADLRAGPCEVILRHDGREESYRSEFRPEKQWKLYAGLKVHNDLGYTNLQKNVEALHERNVDQVLKVLRERPAHQFNLENSWLADAYLGSRNPAQRDELIKVAQSGRLGVSAFYLNLLTGLCSGEELHRALYFTAGLQREHGVPMRFGSLTDTPSQSWALASILPDAGVTGFALGSNQHRGPLLINSDLNETSPFYWEGPDGRRILTFVGRAYHQLGRMSEGSLPLMARNVAQALVRYQRPDYPLDALYLLGWLGDNNDVRDAGAGAIARWNAEYAFPRLIAATDSDYFDYVEKNFGAQLATRRGDMGAYWADAAGSTAAATIESHDAQRSLPAAEMIASWASLLGPEIAYPAAEFQEAWNSVLLYNEHSWGANNSITQPGQQFGEEQKEFKTANATNAKRIAHNLLNVSLARLTQHIDGDGPAVMAVNPSAHPRTAVLEVEIDSEQEIFDPATDKPVPLDVVSEHEPQDVGAGLRHWYSGLVRPWRTVRFVAEDVPGFGYKCYEIRRTGGSTAQSAPAIASWELHSAYYDLALDPQTGAIKSIYDVELKRQLLDQKAPHGGNELVYAAGGEGQTIINNLHEWPATRLEVSGPREARLLEHVRTPFGERLRLESRAKNVPRIETEITIYDRLKRIDIVNRIRKDDILKKEAIYFAFPFSVTPPELRYQVQNGWVRPDKDLLPGACRDFFTTQNVVLANDPSLTVAFATPDLPLVTLTDLNRGRWSKDFKTTNGHVYSYVTNNYWDTNIPASQSGDLEFRYYVTSMPGLDYDRVAAFDAATRSPVIAYRVRKWFKSVEANEARLSGKSGALFAVDAPNVQVSACKRAEDGDGYIVRLLETSGRNGVVHLKAASLPLQSAFQTNGVEVNQGALKVDADGVAVPLAPHRFSTVRLKFASPKS